MLGSLRREAAERVLAERRARLTAAPDLDALERETDGLWTAYREALAEGARAAGGLVRGLHALDRAQWTDRVELMDLPDLDEGRRGAMLDGLDRFNRLFRIYQAHARLLRPALLRAASGRGGGAVRLLDVASGRGGFPRFLARHGPGADLSLEVTGSDLFERHVEHARRAAAEEGVPARFEVLNALAMEGVEEGRYDVVSCEDALHHFTPGQLARLVREGLRVASTAFVGIDGVRSPLLAPAVVAGSAVFAWRTPWLLHDAVVTARRFFHLEELRLIALAAWPGARVEVAWTPPGLQAVRVYRQGAGR